MIKREPGSDCRRRSRPAFSALSGANHRIPQAPGRQAWLRRMISPAAASTACTTQQHPGHLAGGVASNPATASGAAPGSTSPAALQAQAAALHYSAGLGPRWMARRVSGQMVAPRTRDRTPAVKHAWLNPTEGNHPPRSGASLRGLPQLPMAVHFAATPPHRSASSLRGSRLTTRPA